MKDLFTCVKGVAQGLGEGSAQTTGEHIIERVEVTAWLPGFDVASATLTPDQAHNLSVLAGALHLIPDPNFVAPAQDPDPRVDRIVGHASRTGNEVKNRTFALERAQAVRQRLLAMGVPAARIAEPETAGSRGQPPTPVATTLEDMARGAEIPEHRTVEIHFSLTVSRPRLDTIDWSSLAGGILPSDARRFAERCAGVGVDTTLGGVGLAMEILAGIPAASSTGLVVVGGAAVNALSAIAVPVMTLYSLANILDGQERRIRLWAMCYQTTLWALDRTALLLDGPILRPEQPTRMWDSLDLRPPYATPSDLERNAARRVWWREACDEMQATLRQSILNTQQHLEQTLAQAPEPGLTELVLRQNLLRNASGSPDRLATGQEALDHVYALLLPDSGVTYQRPLTWPSASLGP